MKVLLVNGTPITLEGEEGLAIKECLLKGAIPNQDLINHLLIKAGLLLKPVKVSTELTVKDTRTKTENVILHRNGTILDEKSRAGQETQVYSSTTEEDWLPISPEEQLELTGPVDSALTSGKSLRDRLQSCDSVNICDESEVTGGERDSQDSLAGSLDRSFDTQEVASCGSSTSSGLRESGLCHNSEGVLVSGTLEELIHELLPRAHSCPSDSFAFSFLLSSRLYLTPWHLMGQLHRRADQLAIMMSTASHPAFVANLLRLLSSWMTWFPQDFQEEATMSKLRKLTSLCVSCDPGVQARVTQLSQSLLKHLTAVDRHKQYVDKLRQQRDAADSDTKSPVDILSVGWQPSVIAQQLTHLELQYLSFIGPDEFVNAFARDSNKHGNGDTKSSGIRVSTSESCVLEARLRAGQKTTNLEAYIAWFNRLSFLIASSVIRNKRKKYGARTIEFWIEVARECVNIGNFNSMMGIISGLNMGPVSRLKRTWTKIAAASGKFTVLGHQMDPSSNFVSYRTTLQAAVSRSENATDKKQRVVIPFFSLLLKDLYFVNEGCASKLSNGHINMEKARTLAEHVSQFMKWKDMECPYEKLPRVLDYLEKSPAFTEAQLEYESYMLEPPEGQSEKDLYKELKTSFKK